MFHVIMGLPGTGKTTAAHYLAEKFCPNDMRARYFGSDFFENKLFANQAPPSTQDERMRRRHAAIIHISEIIRFVHEKKPQLHWVVDGAFRTREERGYVLKDIVSNGWPYSVLLMTAQGDVARKRVQARHAGGISRCTVEDYELATAQFEKVRVPYRNIDNSGSIADLQDSLEEYLSSIQRHELTP